MKADESKIVYRSENCEKLMIYVRFGTENDLLSSGQKIWEKKQRKGSEPTENFSQEVENQHKVLKME